MKSIFLILLLFVSFSLFGQKSNTLIPMNGNSYAYFDIEDFKENAIKSVEAYSFKLNKRGKVKSDSIRLYVQIFNPSKNKISGINCNTVYQSHGPSFLSWYKFEKYFDAEDRLIRKVEQPLNQNRRKEYGSTKYEININEDLNFYNQDGQLEKEVYNRIENSYSISKYTKDTFHLHTIHPKIYEYFYDDLGREVERFYTDDSTRYLKTNSYIPDSSSVHCFYCDARHLNGNRKYGANGKLHRWTWFTDEGEIHTKKYYYYDKENRIQKIVDSIGWYLMEHSNDYPVLSKTTEYIYQDTFLWKVIETQKDWITEQEFNSFGNVLKDCSGAKSDEFTCAVYAYKYKNGKLVKMERKSSNNRKFILINEYDKSGLIKEERQFENGKLISLVRYKYWKYK